MMTDDHTFTDLLQRYQDRKALAQIVELTGENIALRRRVLELEVALDNWLACTAGETAQ